MATMAAKSKDFYGVLGLNKDECTTTEIRNAYKKLAMKWHPDRCSPGNEKQAEEGKKKFQAIQEAYSVLSDPNKRFLYDVGLYDKEDEEDEMGMGSFVDEMMAMMCQNKPNENAEEGYEEFQELFDDIFQGDVNALGSSSTSNQPCNERYNDTKNKRNYSQISSNAASMDETTNNTFPEFHIVEEDIKKAGNQKPCRNKMK